MLAAQQMLLCTVASASTSILLNVPRRALTACGLMGTAAFFAAGWFGDHGASPLAANFLAALIVAVLAEITARLMRLPVSIFTVPGVIPLVPGVTAYKAMFAFVQDQYDAGNSLAISAVLLAAAISAGLVMGGSIFHIIDGQRKARRRRRLPIRPGGPPDRAPGSTPAASPGPGSGP